MSDNQMAIKRLERRVTILEYQVEVLVSMASRLTTTMELMNADLGSVDHADQPE